MQSAKKVFFNMLGLSIVICRNKQGKYLAIREKNNLGWWVAGGKLDPPSESFPEAAIREVKEEAEIDVELIGILQVQYSHLEPDIQLIRFIFYAEPKDETQKLKSVPDNESEEAQWFTLKEIENLKDKEPGWRGPELYEWAKYIQEGGVIYPSDLLICGKCIKMVTKEAVKTVKDLK